MEGLPERGRCAFWGRKTHPKTTPVVKEGPLPRQHREHATAERVAMDEEVGQAVEKDDEGVRRRMKRILMFVVVALVVSAIVDIACHDNVRTWLETSFDWIEDNPKAGECARLYSCKVRVSQQSSRTSQKEHLLFSLQI